MRKNEKQYIDLNCSWCGGLVRKEKKEYDRRTKAGCVRFYCSKDCVRLSNNEVIKQLKTVSIPCEHCGEVFLKKEWQHKKNIARGVACYCSRECRSGATNAARIKKGWTQIDSFSPFRYFVNAARNSTIKHRISAPDITAEYLKELWEIQKGICPYTGLAMRLRPNFNKDKWDERTPTGASLDRIDSSKGYVKGNVQFVCLSMNYAKNGFSDQQIKDFVDSIRKQVIIS